MSLQSLRSVLLIVGAVAVLISCSKSPEDARKELVQLGIPYESSAFIESAGRGDLAAVKLFIRANMDPNVDHGEALVEAVRRNRREVIDYLLDNGANADSKGRSLLTSTGMKDVDNVDLITHLLDKGANINYQSVTKPTWDPLGEGERIYVVIAPLSNALEEKNVKLANTLLDRGAKGDAHALIAATITGNVDIIERVLNTGVDINAKYRYNSVLVAAGSIDLKKWLLEHGANVNTSIDHLGNSLIYSTFSGTQFHKTKENLDVLKLLLSYKPDLDFGNNPVRTNDLIKLGDSEITEMVNKLYLNKQQSSSGATDSTVEEITGNEQHGAFTEPDRSNQEEYSNLLFGMWHGSVHQSDDGDYVVNMELQGKNGLIEYPSLHCGGTVKFLGYKEGIYRYLGVCPT